LNKDTLKYNSSLLPEVLRAVSGTPEAVTPVDLSYCPQSHRFYIRMDLYKNGEAKVRAQSIVKKPLKDLLTESFNMPRRNGEIYQQGMTNKAKAKIKLAGRLFQHQVLTRKEGRPYASFITLAYGLHYPSDHLSKKHLDSFFKRLKRKFPLLQYVWCIQHQNKNIATTGRNAPHFHILTPQYIDKELINKAWDSIVSKWQKSQIDNGCKQQKVYPNVGKVEEAGAYMTRYMQKSEDTIGGNLYGIDQITRNLMKPETITLESDYDLNDISEHLSSHLQAKESVVFGCTDFNKNNQYWISKVNEFNLNEFLDYTVPELGMKTYQ
jgi:hypothetical protein